MKSRNHDSGAVLIIVMMTMLGLVGLGLTALWLTSGNLQVGTNMNQRTQALYAAEAGVEQARAILNRPTNPAGFVNNALAGKDGAGNSTNNPLNNIPYGLIDDQPNGVGAVLYDSNQPIVNITFPPPSMQRTQGSAGAPVVDTMGTYTVWIRNDNAECRTNKWTTDENSAVVVRSRGLARDGRTTVVLEVSLGAKPGGPGSPPEENPPPPKLCIAGKNSCDDNNSVLSGMVAGP